MPLLGTCGVVFGYRLYCKASLGQHELSREAWSRHYCFIVQARLFAGRVANS